MLVPPLFPLDEKIRRYSHFAKRSAVILTLRKDPPLSNRGVDILRDFFTNTFDFPNRNRMSVKWAVVAQG